MKKELKILTYNVMSCTDFLSGEVCPEQIGGIIKEIGADICGLNEVYNAGPKEGYCEQAKKLSVLSGMKNYAYALGKKFEWNDEIGNAVLSRYDIVKTEKFAVAAPTEEERVAGENEWYEDRVILKTTIDVGTKIAFIVTHFGLNLSERKRMANKLSEVIDDTDVPIILVGDFNSAPDEEVLLPLYSRLKNVAKEVGNTEYTFSSTEPDRVLDYVFVSKEFSALSFEAKKVVASDHLPCTARLTMEI